MTMWRLLLVGLILGWALGAQAATYFVKNGGSDAADGLSDATAWATLSKVNSTAFSAGDTIQFQRGSTWTGELEVDSHGTSGNPVTYQAYGTGARPIIQAASSPPSGDFSQCINVTGDWNVIKEFLLRNAHEAGVDIQSTATDNVIQDNEVTAVGIGVLIRGPRQVITENDFHDLRMVVNDATPGTDYGANGVLLEGSAADVEVSYNRCVNCQAVSTDFGTDGGFVELFGAGSNTTIHHNYTDNANGILEIGGSGTISGVTLSYNVFYHTCCNASSVCLNTGPTVPTLVVEHNTYYQQSGDAENFRVFGCRTDWSLLTIRNNIFLSDIQMTNSGTPGTHTHNRYHMINMVNGSGVGYTLGTGESTGDPLFVSAGTDFHLQSTSAARDAGTDLGYTLDFDDNPVPDGSAPDMGAYEFQSSDTMAPAAPTNLRVIHP
jgi:hypothetical protein